MRILIAIKIIYNFMFEFVPDLKVSRHPELMRERSIWFLLFEIKRVFVYNSTVFRLTDLYVNTLSFKMYMPTKKYLT